MKRNLPFSVYDLKDSLWYRPGLMTAAAVILSLVTLQLDNWLFSTRDVQLPWLFEGGSEGARGVLTAIASTMITVATTAFSVTLVALQLGSSQFSPRILRSFTGDVGNQMVLGIFIATFAYSLSVLRAVRSEREDFEAFVPTISVTVSLVLAFVSVGSLIYFFHHATRTIQASVVIDRTLTDTRGLIEKQDTWLGEPGRRRLQEPLELPASFRILGTVASPRAGYLQDFNRGELAKLAATHAVVIRLQPRIGDYLNTGTPLVTIWQEAGAIPSDNEREKPLSEAIQGCFEIGMERTLERDSLFGMQQLTDIALLALSPGTNDPTTALSVIDSVGTAVIEAASVSGAEMVCTEDGAIRLAYPVPNFGDYLHIPFDQIRYYGSSDPHVVTHVLRTLEVVAREVGPDHAPEVRCVALEYEESAAMHDWISTDVARMRQAAAWAHGAG
jgi:uncharacterized membrane protein